ncbi:MAG TPA: CCC motif membrane protein [Bacteroidia bacterium]|jgi:uncharacterized membrane protein
MENQGPPDQANVNQQFNQQFGQPSGQQVLPNSTAVLVLGIISIVGCFCYGIIGVVLGIIALVLASKAGALYQQNPGMYSEATYKNMKAGKICAIVGLSLSALYLVCIIIYLCIIGTAISMMPWDMIR